MWLALKVKNFELWRASLGKKTLWKHQVFVRLSLFLISTHSKNLIHLVVAIQKFKIFGDPIEEDPPNVAPPISVPH